MTIVDLVVMGLYAGLASHLLRWLRTPAANDAEQDFLGTFRDGRCGTVLVRRGATV